MEAVGIGTLVMSGDPQRRGLGFPQRIEGRSKHRFITRQLAARAVLGRFLFAKSISKAETYVMLIIAEKWITYPGLRNDIPQRSEGTGHQNYFGQGA